MYWAWVGTATSLEVDCSAFGGVGMFFDPCLGIVVGTIGGGNNNVVGGRREFDVAGLVHDNGVQGVVVGGLGLSIHVVVVASCANGKWSAVALGVDGGGKTCVAGKFFVVDFWTLGLVLVWAFLLNRLYFY